MYFHKEDGLNLSSGLAFCCVQDEGVGAMGCTNVPRYDLSSVSHVWQKPS